MARKTVVEYFCDLCGTSENVTGNRRLTVGSLSAEVDACDTCWAKQTGPALDLLALGRPVPAGR